MGRVVIKNMDDSTSSQFPPVIGVSMSGKVETRSIITDADRPLFLWHHIMAPGSAITIDKPPVDHLLYAFEGEGEAEGKTVKRDGAFAVSHGSRGVLRAGNAPLSVLHFHRPDNNCDPHERPGGCSHVVNKDQARFYHIPETDGYVYLEAVCPTCEAFFHMSTFQNELDAPRHYHDQDEIIFVVDGIMKVGRRQLKRGTALAIDKNTVYKFEVPKEGMAFINFRAGKTSQFYPEKTGRAARANPDTV